MSDSLDGVSIISAAGNPASLQKWMRAVNGNILRHRAIIGDDGLLLADDPNSGNPGQAIPPAVGIAVAGIDGSFQITLTLPQDLPPQTVTLYQRSLGIPTNKIGAGLFHQLQSASNVNFDAAGGVITYGPFTELYKEIQAPNQTLFWQVRSSFDGVNWNGWTIYSSAVTCGPIGVSSGFLRSTSAAVNGMGNSTNNATVDSIDNGSNATIRVYGTGGVGSSWLHYDGQGGQTTYPSVSFAGNAYGTKFLVFYDPTLGGFRAFAASLFFPQTMTDSYIWAGSLTTVAAGGGGGTSGGGGSTSGGGGGGRPLGGL